MQVSFNNPTAFYNQTENFTPVYNRRNRRRRALYSLRRKQPKTQPRNSNYRQQQASKGAFVSKKRKFLHKKTKPLNLGFTQKPRTQPLFCGFLDQQLKRPSTPISSLNTVETSGDYTPYSFDESWKGLMVENHIDQWGTNATSAEEETPLKFDKSWQGLIAEFQVNTFGSNRTIFF